MKTIVITGGSDGFGKALAEELAQSSDNKVIILARNEDALRNIAERCGCEWYVCDVTDAKQVERTIAQVAEEHKTIDVVINNAGVILNGELATTDYADIEKVISTNTLGAIYIAKATLMHMQKQQSGLLVNVISQSGLHTRPNRAVYNASKWAITGLTEALQQEVAQYNVRVTGFYPGTIETSLFAKAGIDMKGPAITTKEAVDAVKYLLSTDDHVLISELGIKHVGRLI